MTWQTPEGNRVLGGAEAELVRAVLGTMVDQIDASIQFGVYSSEGETDIEVYDSLTPTQRIAVVKEVAEYLLTETADTLELTAVSEATVYVIFKTLASEIEEEIHLEDQTLLDDDDPGWAVYWRLKTLHACRECFADEWDDAEPASDDPESPWMTPRDEFSRNKEQWDLITESLADRILWDRDFEMAGSFLDMHPEKAQALKQMLGIDNDYYSNASSDIAFTRAQSIVKAARRITHRKPR